MIFLLRPASASPVDVVLAGRHRAHVGHGQDLLADGLPGGVGGGHRDGRRGLVHAQEFTWKQAQKKQTNVKAL